MDLVLPEKESVTNQEFDGMKFARYTADFGAMVRYSATKIASQQVVTIIADDLVFCRMQAQRWLDELLKETVITGPYQEIQVWELKNVACTEQTIEYTLVRAV